MNDTYRLWLRAGDVLGLRVSKEQGVIRLQILDEADDDEPPIIQATLSAEEVERLIKVLERYARA